MISVIRTALVSVCLLVGTWNVSRGEDKPTEARSAVNGVALSVSLDKPKFTDKDPIKLNLKIENERPDSITVWSCGFWPNHRVEIRDENGKEPPLTEFGRTVREMFASGARDKNVPFIIRPGNNHSYTSGDVRKMYAMKPGKYKNQVLFNETTPPDSVRIVSKSIRFELE